MTRMFPRCYGHPAAVTTLTGESPGRPPADGQGAAAGPVAATYPVPVVDRKDVGSWIEGPRAARAGGGSYPGERLGLPERGPGSVGRFGRRLVAIFIDGVIAQVIGVAFFGAPSALLSSSGHQSAHTLFEASIVPLVFLAENILLVGTVGFTIGHRIMGMRVVRLGGAPAGPLPGLIRSVLLSLAVPALIWDKDERGLHDKAAGTVIIRTR